MTGVKTFWCEFIAGLNAPSETPIHIDISIKPEVNLLYYAPHFSIFECIFFFIIYFIWRHLFRETSQTIIVKYNFFYYLFVYSLILPVTGYMCVLVIIYYKHDSTYYFFYCLILLIVLNSKNWRIWNGKHEEKKIYCYSSDVDIIDG